MTFFGSPGFLLAAGVVIVAALLLDSVLTKLGVIERAPRRVPHRKLRAAAEARRKPATGDHAPSNAPVAGPEPLHADTIRRLQADARRTAHAWMRDAAIHSPSGESQPVPGIEAPGAGTRAAPVASGGPGPQTLVGAVTPDPAPTSPQTHAAPARGAA